MAAICRCVQGKGSGICTIGFPCFMRQTLLSPFYGGANVHVILCTSMLWNHWGNNWKSEGGWRGNRNPKAPTLPAWKSVLCSIRYWRKAHELRDVCRVGTSPFTIFAFAVSEELSWQQFQHRLPVKLLSVCACVLAIPRGPGNVIYAGINRSLPALDMSTFLWWWFQLIHHGPNFDFHRNHWTAIVFPFPFDALWLKSGWFFA